MQTDTHKALCKLLEGDYRNESSIQLVKRVEGLVTALRTERDDSAKTALALNTELNELMCDELLDRLGLENGYTPEQFHASMKVLFNDLSTLQGQVEALKTDIEYNPNTEDWRELCSYFNLPVSELSSVMKAIDTMRRERDKAVRSLESAGFTDNGGQLWKPPVGTPPPYLSQEIRYVLHGDIQPCTVLYSDDTTSLLRLDEGDIMCETDAIEWSDSVTYRCQELLKSAGAPGMVAQVRTATVLAQLVRDERIVLNDDALETVSDEPSPMVVPSAPDTPATPSCSNPYVHDSVEYPEAAMRAAGWQTEDLIQNGYGFYKPVSLAPWEAPSNPEDTWACVKCTHRFPSVCDRCPKCYTPKER